MHHHVAGQVAGRYLHAAGGREDGGVVAEAVVGNALAAGSIGFHLLHKLAVFILVQAYETGRVQGIYAIAAIQSQGLQNMVHYILVEALSGELLNEGARQVKVQIAVLVTGAGLVVVVALFPVLVGFGIDAVQFKVTLAVVNAGSVREQHFQGDDGVRELGVADGETGQVAHIRVKGYQALFDELHHGGGTEGLGDGRNAEEGVLLHGRLFLQVGQTKLMAVDNLVILHHGHGQTHVSNLLAERLYIFFKSCLFGLRATAGSKACGHGSKYKQSFHINNRTFLQG